ncbi:hypothetical protein SAMN05216344_1054 [Polaromonas sp. OV174]|nr:hypothetical protein SAMN05216344_1054 [Polaromonas sp. OV174]
MKIAFVGAGRPVFLSHWKFTLERPILLVAGACDRTGLIITVL